MIDPENTSGAIRRQPDDVGEAVAQTTEDPRVLRHLEEYVKALEEGENPNRETLLGRYPQIADELAACLDGLEFIRHASPQIRQYDSDSARGQSLPGQIQPLAALGDFRIVREAGRGGMGVVYEAEELSLGRRVALKVFPFAAVLDHKQLQRFKNEAHAAAGLHHTNIVPVYSVGCERGVHYYAMQFVEGLTLAEVIRDLRRAENSDGKVQDDARSPIPNVADGLATRQFSLEKQDSGLVGAVEADVQQPPSDATSVSDTAEVPQAAISTEQSSNSPAYFRSVAGLGVQAAEALDYAHEEGVLHRDIKPSNLILDARGKLWITDFGLARIESEPGLTMTGDLLGTLRYMSPEQALAKRTVVDHRSDVYSLGVTLYELLTLQPAFPGDDRVELLRRMAFEEPKRPRQLNKAVPVELETIILKAMAYNTAERYDSAQDFADDLGRFLEDKPIRARRASAADRLAKWSRRHKAVVWSGVFLLLMAAMGFATSTFMVARERDAAQHSADEATVAAVLESEARAEAERQRERAEANLQLALKALDETCVQAMRGRSADTMNLAQEDQDLLKKALGFYEQFVIQNRADSSVREQTAHAYFQVANLQKRLGDRDKAEESCRRAISLYEALAAKFPDVDKYHFRLAQSHTVLGVILSGANRVGDAEEALRRAADLLERLVADFPGNAEYRFGLAQAYGALAEFVLQSTQSGEAEETLRKTVLIAQKLTADFPDHLDYQSALAQSYQGLGSVLQKCSNFPAAEQSYRKCLALREKLADERPEAMLARKDLAHIYRALGALLRRQPGRLREAEKELRKALAVDEELTSEFPALDGLWVLLAADYRCIGLVLEESRKIPEAEEYFRKAVALCDKVAADGPGPHWQSAGAADSFQSLGYLLLRRGELDEARPILQKAVQHRRAALEGNPNESWYRDALYVDYLRLVDVLVQLCQNAKVEESLAEMIDVFDKLAAEHPLEPEYQRLAAIGHTSLGNLLKEQQKLPEAEQAFCQAVAVCEKLVADFPENVKHQRQLAATLQQTSVLLQEAGRAGEALNALIRVKHIFQELVDGNLADADDLRCVSRRYIDLADLFEENGHPQESRHCRLCALQVYEKLALDFPDELQRGARERRADAYYWRGDLDRALADYAEAIRSDPASSPLYCKRAAVYLNNDQPTKAIADCDEAIRFAPERAGIYSLRARSYWQDGQFRKGLEDYKKALELGPTNAGYHNRLAWYLVTCPDTRLHDPALAVQLADKAVELKAATGTYWNTLGVAQYRATQPKASIESLRKSMELRSGGDAFDWFFLAMAHWQLNHEEEARKWYDQAVEWMEMNEPDDEELIRVSTETAELLGITDEVHKPEPSAPTPDEKQIREDAAPADDGESDTKSAEEQPSR